MVGDGTARSFLALRPPQAIGAVLLYSKSMEEFERRKGAGGNHEKQILPLSIESKKDDVVFWHGEICVVQGVHKRGKVGKGVLIYLRYLGNTPPGKQATWAVEL